MTFGFQAIALAALGKSPELRGREKGTKGGGSSGLMCALHGRAMLGVLGSRWGRQGSGSGGP